MQILTVDIGTGTQDIFLYDSRLDVENGFKLILPSPTMIVHRKLQQATRRGVPVLLTGVTMGGGPSQWAAEAHLRAGYEVYATPDAARSFNDDLAAVEASGIRVIGEDESLVLPEAVQRIELRDFNFGAIRRAMGEFGVSLEGVDALAVAVFDHGAAPPEISDRQFRFDYLEERIRSKNRLTAFAFPAENIPPSMTRLQAVAASARGVDAPVVVMDTAPAAVLGATFDPVVRDRERVVVANVGNFHTLAFRLGPAGIEGVFEHHTGLIDLPKLEGLLTRLADGTLEHAMVFGDHGHGALILDSTPLSIEPDGRDFGFAATGPRRNMVRGSRLRPYFAVPFGDMMIAGCFGLLAGAAECLPELREQIQASLAGAGPTGAAPWDVS